MARYLMPRQLSVLEVDGVPIGETSVVVDVPNLGPLEPRGWLRELPEEPPEGARVLVTRPDGGPRDVLCRDSDGRWWSQRGAYCMSWGELHRDGGRAERLWTAAEMERERPMAGAGE